MKYLSRTALKETYEDWYPPITGKKCVRVRLLTLSDGKTRVCVWGGDDFGMEKDFDDALEAERVFNACLEQDKIHRSFLKKLGFVNA